MSELDFLLPWDSQPQEAVSIDWSNPLSKGLHMGFHGPSLRDVVMDDQFINVGGAARSIVRDGVGVRGTAAASYLMSQRMPVYPTNKMTVLAGVVLGSSWPADAVAVYGHHYQYNTNDGLYDLGIVSATGKVRLELKTGLGTFPSASTATSLSLATGRLEHIGGTYDGANIQAFYNGLADGSAIPQTATLFTNGTPRKLIGANFPVDNSNANINGHTVVYVFAWHDRVLSADEIRSIRDNPWQLFEPQTIWVPVSAGGGATNLIIQEALHSHTADNIGLTLDTFLSVQEALHSHAADNLVLSVTGSTDLTVQETLHSHTADNLALTLDTFLLLQDALHAHAADNITLSTGAVADLVIQEALHAHTADALVLTLDTFLVIQEAAHAHGADNIAFTLDSLLAVQEATHGHLADNLILSIPGSALSDAEFRQMYDWISELHLVHGLRAGNPLTVTPTSRAAGAVDQTIGEVGTTVTVTRI